MIWKVKHYSKNYLMEKSKEFNKDFLITTLLLNRGIKTKEEAQNYLKPTFNLLNDPFLLNNMEEVVNTLLSYRGINKKILIFGDYDIDGISASIYLSKMFEKLNIQNEIYIPKRSIFKYNLEDDFFEYVKNFDLIITVDNSFGKNIDVEKILSMKKKLIITDHHYNNKINEEVLEINPRKSENYPFKELSGSGVVFKLVHAIYSKIYDRNISEIYEYIELIALATIADVMENTDENRFIVKRGIKNFTKTKILALNMILDNLKIIPEYIGINDISYRISPLLNAISKLDNPLKIIKFFTSNNENEIKNILKEMYDFNIERKNAENLIFNDIVKEIKKKNIKKLKYIYYEIDNVNLALLGSLASKLVVEFKVPVIIISNNGKFSKASCRSLENKNIYNLILEFSKYFENYGGHELAAGFLIKKENLIKIRKKLKNKLSLFNEEKTKNILHFDSILNMNKLDYKIMKEIARFEPHSFSNSELNFYAEKVKIYDFQLFGIDNKHFKGIIKNNINDIQVVGYNLSKKIVKNTKNITLSKIIYTPELIDKKLIKIKIKDIK